MPNVLDLRYGIDSILKIKVQSWEQITASELEWSADDKNAHNMGDSTFKRAIGASKNTNKQYEVKA